MTPEALKACDLMAFFCVEASLLDRLWLAGVIRLARVLVCWLWLQIKFCNTAASRVTKVISTMAAFELCIGCGLCISPVVVMPAILSVIASLVCGATAAWVADVIAVQ